MRIEALSDGVFSIVMTLLIIDIKVPQLGPEASSFDLWRNLWHMWPLFRSFYISFAILGMYWISHHALFHLIVKNANRPITYLNILFLCFISLIPFSAHLIGQYPLNETAVMVYGANVIVIGAVQLLMMRLTMIDVRTLHDGVNERLIHQSVIRMLLPPVFSVFGIIACVFHSSISFFLFAFPVVFNIIPGGLTLLERVFSKREVNG